MRLVALAGISLSMAIAATGVAEVPNVYFPATSAYYRHNYDPFDQATTAAAEVRPVESGDIQLSSEIHLIAAERFEHAGAKPVNQVIPAALQAVPQDDDRTVAAAFAARRHRRARGQLGSHAACRSLDEHRAPERRVAARLLERAGAAAHRVF